MVSVSIVWVGSECQHSTDHVRLIILLLYCLGFWGWACGCGVGGPLKQLQVPVPLRSTLSMSPIVEE